MVIDSQVSLLYTQLRPMRSHIHYTTGLVRITNDECTLPTDFQKRPVHRMLSMTFESVTLEQFLTSLAGSVPPAALPPLLVALWWDRKGDWGRGHGIAQSEGEQGSDREAAWVHAYLHRKEGDIGNAQYWYRRARQPVPETTLDEEWKQIVIALLGRRENSQ